MLLLQSLLCCRCCRREGHRTSWHGTDVPSASLGDTGSPPVLMVLGSSPAPLPCPGDRAGCCPAFAGAVHKGTAISDCSWEVLMSVGSVCLSHGCTTLVASSHLRLTSFARALLPLCGSKQQSLQLRLKILVRSLGDLSL